MRAMVLNAISDLSQNDSPLVSMDMPIPVPGPNELLVHILACGVCHTELDEIEGRTPPAMLPIIPGHQIVGRVEAIGSRIQKFKVGDRVGIGWIYSACGACGFCRSGQENLCDDFKATGRDANGGYAEFTKISEGFAFKIPDVFSDAEAAPLLCAGAIGYRSLRLTGITDHDSIGLAGFGASGHLVLKMVQHAYPHSRIFVFSRTEQELTFARELGADWAGTFENEPPVKLQAVIDTTPAWNPVVKSLRYLERGGRLVINAIRKEDRDKNSLLELNYSRDLWMEKEIKSVANITRRDIEEFLALAAEMPMRPEIQTYQLRDANRALMELKRRQIRGAKVLVM